MVEVAEHKKGALSTPTGFKQTEVGVIPKDWELRSIQELIDKNYLQGHLDGNHGELYPRNHEFVIYGVPYIAANDFVDGIVRFGKCKNLSYERANVFKKGVAKNGDVLFAHNATVGPVALLETNLDFIILSTTATYFRCNPEKLINKYLLHGLRSRYFVAQYEAIMMQSTRAQVPITAQRKLSILFPPTLAEQTAIATALSDVDALITAQEKLIAKKRALKQGAMQELLKPKEGWEERPLNDIVNYIHGKAHEQYIDKHGEYVVVNSKFISSDGQVVKFSSHNFCPAKKDDVLTVLSDLPNGKALAKCFLVPTEKKYAVNQRVCIWRSKKADPKFLFYILNRNSYFLALDDGISQTHILNHHIEKCRISIPVENKEQTRIARILSDMDAEIEQLEAQLAKYRQMKVGMMQELLTGKKRLV